MRISFPGLVADAWRLARADWEVVSAIAGLFVFLPALGIALLIPDLPDLPAGADASPGSASMVVYQTDVSKWIVQFGAWQLGAQAIILFGQFAIVALYLAGSRPSVGAALAAALRRYALLIGAGFIVAVPMLAGLLLSRLFPFLLIAFFVVVFWTLARTVVMAPVLLAEAPIGPLGAVRRSLDLTRGNTFALAASVMFVVLVTVILTIPLSQIDMWMVKHSPNPIARTIVDIIAALVAASGTTAMALIQVSAYRRLRTR